MVEEDAQSMTVMVFWDYYRPLEKMLPFKYQGRLLVETNDKCPAVITNIWQSRK